MQQHNAIDRHRNEIEKRIHQLEGKFHEGRTHLDSIRPYVESAKRTQKVQKYGRDQLYSASRTLQMKSHYNIETLPPPRIAFDDHYPNQRSNQQQEIKRQINPQRLNPTFVEKQNVAANAELFQMMKVILEGQKNIQKELNQLRNDYLKDSQRKKIQEPFEGRTPILKGAEGHTINNGIPIKTFKETNDFNNQNQEQKATFTNQLANKESATKAKTNQIVKIDPKMRSNSCNRAKPGGIVRGRKGDKFDDLIELVKNQRSKKERFVVKEEVKSRIWKQVENRIRESESQYKDTFHRNNKHEHEHLIGTFELQKKMKEDLIAKVSHQCNYPLFK